MKTFTIDNDLADSLEREILIEGIPKYSYLKQTSIYNYNNNSKTAGGINIVPAQGFAIVFIS